VSADPGTVFELGYAFMRDKKVFGYTNVPKTLQERVAQTSRLERGPDGRLYADDGMAVEDFQLSDNLMLVEAIMSQGHRIIQPAKPPVDLWRDLAAFEACIRHVAEVTHPARSSARIA
jgi:nucleoside 2-deoxyribosyltransferase